MSHADVVKLFELIIIGLLSLLILNIVPYWFYMVKKIFPYYICEMHYYLLSMSDNELDDFYINDVNCRDELFDAMKAQFDSFGPITQKRIRDAIEFILSFENLKEFWGYVVPGAVPLDEIEDKRGYLRDLYKRLTGTEPSLSEKMDPVELVEVIGPYGINVRL